MEDHFPSIWAKKIQLVGGDLLLPTLQRLKGQ